MIYNAISEIGNSLKDIVFPPRCAVCDAVLPIWTDKKQEGICPSCKAKLPYVEEPRCLKCGKEIESDTEEYCADCQKLNRSYKKGFPLFHYVPPVSDAVLAMKYKNRQEYADFYGREIAGRFGASFHKLGKDICLVPIPIHKNRLRKRGYNQAELLAETVGKYTGIPVRTDILIRVEDTKPQKELNPTERTRNLSRAFQVSKNIRLPDAVMLVDDIYTTGATIEACTELLKQAGVKDIYYTSICIGKV